MSCTVTNIKIEPVNASWQIEEAWCVDTVADSSSSLDGKFFTLCESDSLVPTHYVWYKIAASDPAPAGLTGIEVDISANDSADDVADASVTAINALSGTPFTALTDGNHMTIYCADAAVSGGAADDDTNGTGFLFTQAAAGGSLDLGLLEGDVELALEEKLFEVTAHQYGPNKIADVRQGVSVEIDLTLKESSNALYKELISAAGGAHTVTSGTEVFGWGRSKQGVNTVSNARRLILHPVRLDDNVLTDDFCAWKAYPMIDSVTFSGENPKMMKIKFKCYIDNEKPDEIELFSIGDWSQYVPVTPT